MADLDAASLEDVSDFFRTFYAPNNAVLSVCGDIDPASARESIERYFGGIQPGPPVPPLPGRVQLPARLGREVRETVKQDISLARLYLTWRIPPYGDDRFYAAMVASYILTWGKASLLYRTLVRRAAVLQDVSAYAFPIVAGASMLAVWATARPGVAPDRAEASLLEQIAVLANVQDADVERAKNLIESRQLAELQRADERADHLSNVHHTVRRSRSHQYRGRPAPLRADRGGAFTGARFPARGQPCPALVPASGRGTAMSTLRTEAPEPGQLRPYEPPAVWRGRLDNGITVLAARHGVTPLVTIRVALDAGTLHEPPVFAGLATLMAESLDSGAGGRTGEKLAWEFERLGLELHTEASWDATWLEVTTAVERLDPALALIADVLRRPDFPAAEIERVRDEQLAEILQRRKEPRALANDMVLHFLFGDDAPYGRPPIGLPERVRALIRDDVVSYHRQRVQPQATAVILVGHVEPGAARDLVARHFGDWSGPSPAGASPAAAQLEERTVIHIVDRPGSVQSEIRVAHVGVERNHPDHFALRVMNTVLGGAFTSRLNLSLRERYGFTYGVRSGFAFRRAPGPFMVQTAVATEVTARSVEEILRELRLMHDAGARADEVSNARAYLAGVIPLELQTTEQVAARFSDLVVYGLPDDYFAGYRGAIQAVNTGEVARVARQHLQPDRLTICVVGDASAIQGSLEALVRDAVHVHAVPE